MNKPILKCARDRKAITAIARDEVKAWEKAPVQKGLVMAIIFSLCHRLTTGETVEELLDRCSSTPTELDYSI